jgi:tetratricopeptide (TPR) repeat protein
MNFFSNSYGVIMRRLYLWIFVILMLFSIGCASLSKLKNPGQSIADNKKKSFNSTAVQHFIRGSVNELLGDYKAAHFEYSQALLYDTSSATIYNKIAEQYIRMQNIQSAKKMLLVTANRFPDNIVSHEILASIFFSEKEWKKAEQQLQKIIALDPLDIDSHYNLITAYIHQGQDLKVAEQYKKMIQIGFGSPEMQIKIGEIYLQNRLFDKAEKAFKDFLMQHVDDERSYLALAKLSITQKDTVSAIDWYKKGIQKNKNFDTCLEELRDIYIKQQKWNSAISLLKQTIAKDTSKIEISG